MNHPAEQEVIAVVRAWDKAMIQNEAEAIGRYMADDWELIAPDGRGPDKATFLAFVRSGELTHDTMESNDLRIRLYGDTAVVTARGFSGGMFRGQPFRELERATSVFVLQNGEWRCVITNVARLAPA